MARKSLPDAVAPDGSAIHYLVLDATRASLVEVRLGEGRVSRPVRHRAVEEIWYFLAGQGRVWHAGETREVGPGDRLVIRAGVPFQFAADAGELRFLCFTSPPWPGDSEAEPSPEAGLGPPTA
jgi:mannose-6-phosphate isomerase-like protein (cupin superfamily)